MRFRLPGGPVYRKRHLYRTSDQRELNPLFLSGSLDERSAPSWTTDRMLVTTFGDRALFGHRDVAAGAIFEHEPTAAEMVLTSPRGGETGRSSPRPWTTRRAAGRRRRRSATLERVSPRSCCALHSGSMRSSRSADRATLTAWQRLPVPRPRQSEPMSESG